MADARVERLRQLGRHPDTWMGEGATGLLVTSLPPGILDGAVGGHNPALRDFARTRMLYQMLSLSLVRGDVGVSLYSNESDEFAWCFDPGLVHAGLGAVNNLGTGHHTDRSGGLADAYLCSVLAADEPDEAAAAERGVYDFLERRTDFAPNLLEAQSLPFEIFVAPPASCPWPAGEWPPPLHWWLQKVYAHRGSTPSVPGDGAPPHRTVFARAQRCEILTEI